MAVTLLDGHVSRALDFYNKPDIYIGVGKTTPWEPNPNYPSWGDDVSEENPPTPLNTDVLLEPAGFKKVESKFLVVQDDEGQLSYQNRKWRIVPYDEAIAEHARWVYISVYLAYSELPTDISYRQIGVFTGMRGIEGLESDYVLLPDQVADQGIGEALDNRKPIYREPDQREQIKIIIEF